MSDSGSKIAHCLQTIGMPQLLQGVQTSVHLGVYFSLMAWYAVTNEIYGTLPFIFLFQAGFLYAAFLSLFENVGKLGLVQEQEA